MNTTIKYLILTLLLFTLVTMPMTVPMFKSSTPYSMFNRGWDGTSQFAALAREEGMKVVPLFEPLTMANLSRKSGVLMIIGPDVPFIDGEIEQIQKFLQAGNTLFIADDFGTANQILRELNLPVRISKLPLNDFFYQGDDRLIVTVRIANPFLRRGVKEIVTNEPAGIILLSRGAVYSSDVAMINFKMRAYPLMTEERYGNGHVIVLSDPDVLANMQFKENRPFLRNLIEYLGGDTIYMDEAHHSDFNLYTTGTITISRVLPREKALRIVQLVALIVLVVELGVAGGIRRALAWITSKFLRRGGGLERAAVAIAREHNLDEKEFLEMLKRIDG